MFKRLFVFLTLLFALSMIWGQGVETFANSGLTTTYSDGSFEGDGGITWSYGRSRDEGDFPIDGNGLMFHRPVDSFLEATISGGIGTFSFQYRKAFTGANARQLELLVNGVVVDTTPIFGNVSGADPTIHTMTVNDINVAGDVTIRIQNVAPGPTTTQTTIDNIVWTGYTGAAIPTIAASGTLSAFNTSVGTPSAAQSYTLQGLNLTQNISVTAPAGFEISSDNETFTSTLSLAPSYNGSVYVRLTGTTLGEYSGDITHTSAGATQVDKAVSGTVAEEQDGYFVDFEGPGETNGSYASATVNLSSLDWDLTETLIGTEAGELINGIRTARLRGYAASAMTMLEDKTGGLGTISFLYKTYNATDQQANWKVEYSTTAGASWIQIGDSFTATPTVQTFSETVDAPGNVRVKISVDGNPGTGNKRINIDDILMTNYGAVVPFINISGTLNAFATEVGFPSTAQTYTLSGDNLTSNIQIAAPAGFEISSNGSTYSNSLSLSPSYDGSVYVRLTGTTLGEYSGNITHNSTDAQEVTLPVSGEVYEPAEPGDPIVLFVEDFAYDAETDLVGTGGWLQTGTGANNPIQIVEGNLSYPGYVQNAGNMAYLDTTGQDANHTFAPQTEGSVYAAVLVNVDSAQAAGDYFMHFGQEDMGSYFGGRVFLKQDGDSDNAFIGLVYSSGAGAVTQYTTTSYPFGSTILLVLKYDIIPGEKNDVTSLFINPTPNAPEPTADLISASGYNAAPADLVSVGSFGLRQGNFNNAAALGVDGIRITNDWDLLWTTDEPETPVIYAEGDLDEVICIVGTPSEEYAEYTLYGENLRGPITVTAPEHFQVTTDPEGEWASQIQVSATFNGTIYVRIYTNVMGEHAGNIVHSSTDAADVHLRIEGEAIAPLVGWGLTNNMGVFEADYGEDSNVQSYSLNVTGASLPISIEITKGPFVFSKTSATGPWTAEDELPANFSGNIWVKMISTRDVEVTGEITHDTLNASPLRIDLEGVIYPPTGDFAQDLFISEYVEGSGNNKALEIFNGTGMSVDLSNYRLLLFANGNSTPNNTHNLSGTLAHGDVMVYVHSGAGDELAALGDDTSAATNFNGDDAISLQKQVDDDWIDIDIFGVIGEDPGTEWTADGGYSTLDKTLVRKASVTQGVSVNPTGHEANSPSGFATLATEWDVYPINTFEYLGFHIFAPGGDPVAETPQISPAGGLKTEPIYVTMSTDTAGATIYYTTDGNEPTEASSVYQGQFLINETTTVKAKAFAVGYTPSATATVNYSFPVMVNSIAELRAKPTGNTYAFKLATEAILTYQNANRGTKYLQDNTAAIVIDDFGGIITTQYQLYDGITGVTGYLNKYNELLQFVPLANAPAATSHGNVVIPEVRTLASLTTDDQAKLIKVMNITLDATGDFLETAQNINIVDSDLVMRTFADTDYANTPIPQTPVNVTALVGQFYQAMQISPRFLSDFEAGTPALDAPELVISEAGDEITVSWAAVTGATNYKVYGSDDPYGGFTLLQSSSALSYSETAGSKRFYYVIAE